MVVEFDKARELAANAQGRMNQVVKEADTQNRKKDNDISRMQKTIDNLRTENRTYASLQKVDDHEDKDGRDKIIVSVERGRNGTTSRRVRTGKQNKSNQRMNQERRKNSWADDENADWKSVEEWDKKKKTGRQKHVFP